VTARWNARESDAVDKVDMTVRPFVTICVRTTHGGSSSATAAMARGSGDAHRMEMSVPQFKVLCVRISTFSEANTLTQIFPLRTGAASCGEECAPGDDAACSMSVHGATTSAIRKDSNSA
jgi:hypothetical protein